MKRLIFAASIAAVLGHAAFAQELAKPTAPAAKPAAAVAAPATAPAAPTKAPQGAEVYFITPEDGATVDRVFPVKFGLRGMGVAPAGTLRDATGHHHLLVDAKDGAPKAGASIANDQHHLHFGGGQTETTLALPPGDHTLQLVFGDATHQLFDPPLASKTITVHVKPRN